MKISINDLGAELIRTMESYGEAIAEGVSEDVEAAAQVGMNSLRSRSPKRTGSYRKGWRKRRYVDDKGRSRSILLYNATDYQLTHLLEHGHQMPNGGRYAGEPHIAPAERDAEQTLLRRVTRTIEEAGEK